jgi:hypothetical protein
MTEGREPEMNLLKLGATTITQAEPEWPLF